MPTSPDTLPTGPNDRLKAKMTKALEQLDLTMASLDEYHQRVVLLQKQLKALIKSHEKTQNQLIKQLSSIAEGIGTGGTEIPNGGSGQLMEATKKMQETQMSFNLQYLQLQSQMQQENRSYTAISSIMKTKHDTVKNSVSNIR